MGSIGEILLNTLSGDQTLREDATKRLEAAETQDFAGYAVALVKELSNEQNADPNVRVAAGLALKNTLTARDQARRETLVQRWTGMNPEIKGQIKTALLNTLGSSNVRAGSAAAQVIAAIAAIEIPRQEWPDLINQLLNNVTTDQTNLKLASLQTIGFVCEQVDRELLAQQSNPILTAVVQGARKEEPSDQVRLAALQALYNSLEFVRENFEREGERNFIMQVVCEATQSSDVNVQIAAFECLVRIMQLYYDKMELYMQKALFGLTILGMKHENEKVALQAVEFWSTVCDEEIEIQAEADDYYDDDQPPRKNHMFAMKAVGELIPVLLWLLTKREEDDDEDEWNLPMAAATCLSLLANCVGDTVVPPVIPFIESNIRSPDWKLREAAVMVFGSILEGPKPELLQPLVQQALPLLLDLMRDPVLSVKDTAAWTLGRISDLLVSALQPEGNLQAIITAVVNGLSDSPRVAANCCWCLMNLSEQLAADDDSATTYPLSPYFDGIITALMASTERPGAEVNFRATAYEAISSLVANSAKDCHTTVQQLLIAVLDKLEQSIVMSNQLVGMDEKAAHFEMQANLCSVLTSCIRRLKGTVAPMSDRIMSVLLSVMNAAAKSSTVLEDAFLTVGALASAIEGDFLRYMDSFAPFLWAALQNHEEHQMCSIAVGIVGDICRALNEQVLPYCDNFMNFLLQDLQSPLLHRDVKPAILSCFGDIALAIGGKFETYLNVVMVVLQQACAMQAPANNYDMIDYVNQLREGIIEAYVGIVQGLKSGDMAALLMPHVQHIFQFLSVVYADPERTEALTRAEIGLLGDLAEAFPRGEIKVAFQQQWIDDLIKEGKSTRTSGSSTKEVAKWAQSMIKNQAR